MASDNGPVDDATSTAGPREYGLAPAFRARLWGTALLVVGALLLLVAAVVAVADLPRAVVTVPIVGAVAGLLVLGVLLLRRWYVVRLDDTGYRVRFVRGVGRTQARWIDVEDLTTAFVSRSTCVVLRLRDGSTSTVPVNVIEGDREEFVDELKRRLDAGHGFRRL
jgi:hypothetical protein